jgi:Rrf2 family protein
MKLSTRARYALQAMLAIARMTDGDRPISLGKVAERTRLSRRYLDQLTVSLKNASLLRSVGGRSGGYLLARKSTEIRIKHIVEAAIGPISIVDCVGHPESCLKSELCECRTLYSLINKRITDALDEFTLADLAGGVRETEPVAAEHN